MNSLPIVPSPESSPNRLNPVVVIEEADLAIENARESIKEIIDQDPVQDEPLSSN